MDHQTTPRRVAAVLTLAGGVVFAFPGSRSHADGPPPLTRASFLEDYAATRGFNLGRPTGFRVTPSGDAVLLLRSGPRSFVQDLYEVDLATGAERRLASAEQIAGGEERLTAEQLARRERMRLSARGLVSFDLSEDGATVLLPLGSGLYLLDRASGQTRELPAGGAPPIDARFSPDGSMISSVQGGELCVQPTQGGPVRRLTSTASKTVTNGTAEFVAQEEMGRMRGYWWSPDSKILAYQETDESPVEVLHIADPARPERPPAEWRYPRAGTANARVRLGIVAVEGGPTTWVQWDHGRFPYLAEVHWVEDAPLVILVQDRRQQEQVLLSVDHATGATTPLLTETDAAWLNLAPDGLKWVHGGRAFVRMSEQSGSWRLQLHARDGARRRMITPPDYGLRRLIGVDEQRGRVLIAVSPEPTQVQIEAWPLGPAGGPPAGGADPARGERLTTGRGVHWLKLSDSGVYLRGGETPDGPLPVTVHRPDGTTLVTLRSVAASPPQLPAPEWLTVGDPPLQAVVLRPRSFRPGGDQKLPVLLSVYGGPHSQMVTASARRYLLPQWFADQGFVVVSIDGRGTSGRGREWERAIRGNLIQAPLADQVRGLQALAARLPEMDLNRVGVFGWSFGGYFSAMAVMQRPDVFHAASAGAPVVEWTDYDTHYTERYMGLPQENPTGYRAASVLTHAGQLSRPLLLIHGTADDNVYFLHSMKLVRRLFERGRPCQFLPLPGETHMVTNPLATRRLYERIAGFFQQHLQTAPAAVPPGG